MASTRCWAPEASVAQVAACAAPLLCLQPLFSILQRTVKSCLKRRILGCTVSRGKLFWSNSNECMLLSRADTAHLVRRERLHHSLAKCSPSPVRLVSFVDLHDHKCSSTERHKMLRQGTKLNLGACVNYTCLAGGDISVLSFSSLVFLPAADIVSESIS